MVSHLLVKSLTENAPALSSDLANALGIWLSGLVEADRSMRFTSAREAASFLASRGIFAEDTLADIPETPAVYAAVHPIGVEAALGAVVDFHFEDTELPVVELSGEAGIGKTMFLKSLVHGQAAIQRNSNYLQALYISAFESKQATAEPSTILATLQTLFDAQKPALLLIDDAEHLSDEERRAIRDMLDAQSVRKSLASVIRIVAAHRTQLAVLGGKSHTLSRFTASQLTAMCSEILGRCAFTPDIYKDLYNATKGHPLFVEELLRHLVRSQAIVRVQRVWTVQENFGAALKAATSLPSLLAWHFKNCSEAAQHLLATLAVLAKPVPLYELAEALDISTQAVMSVLLPLVFDGYIRFEQAYASISHEIYREAITESLAQQIAILQTATSQQTAPHLEPRQDENTAQETPIPSPSLQVESNLSLLSLTGGIFSGTSAAVQRLRRQIELTAQYDIPALLEGQLGTGKEEIASLIHALSKRSTAPFHAVVCTDFSPAELEQYLFNGSTNLIAQTQGGTIFLDDIASATQAVQAKLARLAQARLRTPSRLQHINTLSTQVTDVRILLGCDRNGTGSPEQAMQEGRLYPELFFAVSSMRVIAPSLDERREDIPAIASYFLTQTAQEFASVELTPLTDGVMKSLSERRWTGNVMELESVVRRMVLSSGGIEDIASLYAPQPARMQNGLDISLLSIDEAQKAHILRALELTGGNKTKAAEMLAIKRTTLIARMKKFGMMP
jgi:DNA-binding NtrC family response regulator